MSVESIEKSIIKKYRKDLWRPFIRALKDFPLIQEGDHVAVGISGGKDSFLLAKLLQELKRHGQTQFELSFICMDPGFNKENRLNLERNAKLLGIPIQIHETKLFEVVEDIAGDYPCYMCARMRRGFLYEQAQKIGANKLALGHHFDDVIETIMMNVLYAGNYMTMMPILNSQNFANLKLIRPMYYIEEKNVIKWSEYNQIEAMKCGCIVAAGKVSSKRADVKKLIKQLTETDPNIGKSILKSSQNIHLDAILGFKRRGVNYSFTEYYDKEAFLIDNK